MSTIRQEHNRLARLSRGERVPIDPLDWHDWTAGQGRTAAERAEMVAALASGNVGRALAVACRNAYRFGAEHGPKVTQAKAMGRPIPDGVYQTPKPWDSAIICARQDEMPRAEIYRRLTRGGSFPFACRRTPLEIPRISKRDAEAVLKDWPWRDARGAKRRNSTGPRD
jgi:hypothetical protein